MTPTQKRKKKKQTTAPELPKALKRTTRQTQKLNRIVWLALFILSANLYMMFLHGKPLSEVFAVSDIDIVDASQHIEDREVALVADDTTGYEIPSIYGKTRKNIAAGEEVLLMREQEGWWQVSDSTGIVMWVHADALIGNTQKD